MTLGTLARYLFGDRRAIETIAASRWSLPVGLILVLTGGLARNYDGAYLATEWPVLFHGPIVSTVNAMTLFTLVYLAARLKGGGAPSFGAGCLAFLGLFWMTAPMAWVYAIPYERWLRPGAAVEANLWTLAAVSAWRVVLISRVLSVLYNASFVPVLLMVLLFADAVLLAVINLTPKPVLDLMGGLQHTEQDATLSGAAFSVGLLAMLSAPVWLIAATVGLRWFRPRWSVPVLRTSRRPIGLFAFSAAAVLAWAPLLAIAQPEQRRRWRAESLLKGARVSEGLAEMSEHSRAEYPPIWDPPPRLGYREAVPGLGEVRAALASGRYAPWVEDEYFGKSWRAISSHIVWGGHADRDDRERLLKAIEERGLPSWPGERGGERRAGLQFHLERDRRLSDEQRERLRTALEAADRAARDPDAGDGAADERPDGAHRDR